MKVKSQSEVAQSCPTLSDLMEEAPLSSYQAPPSMGFSRQEYWSGVPLPSPPESVYLQLVMRVDLVLSLCKMMDVLPNWTVVIISQVYVSSHCTT